MFRAVFAHVFRGVVVLAAMTAGMLWNAAESRAAGCHVADRPVLGGKLSWDSNLSRNLSVAPTAFAPPVLTHPRCEGESPRLLEPVGGPPAVASGQLIKLGSPGRSTEVCCCSPDRRSQPLGTRLYRPPRLIEFECDSRRVKTQPGRAGTAFFVQSDPIGSANPSAI